MNNVAKPSATAHIINKFLLVGDKFMPEMLLREPQFVYSACGPFADTLYL